jgi:hypothetical protein
MEPRKTIALLIAGTALTTLPAAAQNVGTATAVNPDTHATPPGASVIALTVGARIVHKERIQTTPTGTVQLLFLDKSTLSIAPNTNLLIDEFVFDPNAHTGNEVITLAEGGFRFVGGLLSHQGDATVKTPVATIGIRGGTMTVKHDHQHGTRVVNHFGDITIATACGTIVIKRSGFALTIPMVGCPGGLERVAQAEIDQDLKLMTSKPWENGGVAGFHNGVITQYGIGTGPQGNGESNAFQTILQATQHGTGRGQPISPPPPPPPPPPHNIIP